MTGGNGTDRSDGGRRRGAPLPARLAALSPRNRATLALLGILIGLAIIIIGLALLS